MYDHLWLACLADIFLFPYLWQYLLKLYICVFIQNADVLEVFSQQPQIFYICKAYYFLYIYDPFSIQYLAVIFVLFLQMPINFTAIINISHYNCTHMCVYIYKILMCMKYSVDSLQYFTFVSHIFSFTSMITFVFHVWHSY